jgi:hypothetical protein
MTFPEALALIERLLISGGQSHVDETSHHLYRGASWTVGDTRIEVAVRQLKKEPKSA